MKCYARLHGIKCNAKSEGNLDPLGFFSKQANYLTNPAAASDLGLIVH